MTGKPLQFASQRGSGRCSHRREPLVAVSSRVNPSVLVGRNRSVILPPLPTTSPLWPLRQMGCSHTFRLRFLYQKRAVITTATPATAPHHTVDEVPSHVFCCKSDSATKVVRCATLSIRVPHRKGICQNTPANQTRLCYEVFPKANPLLTCPTHKAPTAGNVRVRRPGYSTLPLSNVTALIKANIGFPQQEAHAR